MSVASPAATIVVVDNRHPDHLRVLMLHRSAALDAFPGVWAFPGGRVDASDQNPAWIDQLLPSAAELGHRMETRDAMPGALSTRDYLERMNIQAPRPELWLPAISAKALWPYWVAVVRECFEETGIRLAHWGLGGMLDFTEVHYLGRLVPPPRVSRRFDTRFFAAATDAGSVEPSAGEVQAYQWIDVNTALKSLPLANPTRYALMRMREWQTLTGMLNALQQRW